MKSWKRHGALFLCLLVLTGCAALPEQSPAAEQVPTAPAPPPAAAEPPPGASEAGEDGWLQNAYIQTLVEDTMERACARETDELGRIRAVYEYIVANVFYTEPIGLDCWRWRGTQTEPAPPFLENRALSPLAFGAGWCDDSAAALTLLLRALGHRAEYVPGMTVSVDREYIEHAWVVLELDGAWYHLDPQLERNVLRGTSLPYRYFLKGDAELAVDHLWGESWVAYGYSGKNALTQAQIEEIRALYTPSACEQAYPPMKPTEITLAPPPDVTAIKERLAREKQEFEQANGPLPSLELFLEAPIFGAATAPVWEGGAAQGAGANVLATGVSVLNKDGLYGRSLLTRAEAHVYGALEHAAQGDEIGQRQVLSPGIGPEAFSKVWEAWKNDRPQYYWALPETVLDAAGQVTAFSVQIAAPLTAVEVARRQAELDAAVAALLDGVSGSDFEMACAIHDKLIAATDYARVPGIDDTVNLYGTLVNRQGVCNGLSRAYQYLAQQCGLPSIYIHGTTPWGSSHAWNAVRLSGEWYYVDVTWDRDQERGGAYHDYLLVTWEEISKEHIPRTGQYPTLPQNTARTWNYSVQRGYIAENPREDPIKLAAAFANQLQDQTHGTALTEVYSEIKVIADAASYEVTRNYFIKNMFEVVRGINKIAEEKNWAWRVKETGAVTVDYVDATQGLSILLAAGKVEEGNGHA